MKFIVKAKAQCDVPQSAGGKVTELIAGEAELQCKLILVNRCAGRIAEAGA